MWALYRVPMFYALICLVYINKIGYLVNTARLTIDKKKFPTFCLYYKFDIFLFYIGIINYNMDALKCIVIYNVIVTK